jgi:transposase-like protein
MARPVNVSSIVESLDGGSAIARGRLAAILASCTGEQQVQEAAAALDVSPQRFNLLRRQVLTGALEAAEPKPAGRPGQQIDPAFAALQAENERLRQDLHDAQVRQAIGELRCEMIAAGMGHKLKGLQKKRQ